MNDDILKKIIISKHMDAVTSDHEASLSVDPESYGAMLSSVLLLRVAGNLIETFEQELVARERANNSAPQTNYSK